MDGLEDYYMVEEMLWGAERGAICFTLVSHYFANFHWTWCVGCFCVLLCGLVFVFLWFFLVKILHSIRVSLHFEFPVVDRLCLVLARQCRKKKLKSRSCSCSRDIPVGTSACRGYSYQPFGGKQIHAHPKMHTCWAMDNCREKQGWCDHEWWRGKWIRCW